MDEHISKDLLESTQRMAFNLQDFTHSGRYGRFFNGQSYFDISNDDLVVIELDKLRSHNELFKVVVLQILNSVTQDFYYSEHTNKRVILFEESISALIRNNSTDLIRLGCVIDECYRRSTKYHGSFGIVLQSLLDLKHFGSVGDAIKTHANFKFLFQNDTYRAASEAGFIQYQDLTLDLIDSVKSYRPLYSELFLDTPFGMGVGRLAVDPWNYWINASQWGEVAQFESLIKQGLTPLQAIEQLSKVA